MDLRYDTNFNIPKVFWCLKMDPGICWNLLMTRRLEPKESYTQSLKKKSREIKHLGEHRKISHINLHVSLKQCLFPPHYFLNNETNKIITLGIAYHF